jgi:hypothetical protein
MKTRIISVLLLFALACAPQTTPPTTTNGNANGRFWKTRSASEKTVFLIGLHEGLVEAGGKVNTYFPAQFTYRETIESIDAFYSETENVLIPLIFALPLITMKVNGTQQNVLDRLVADARVYALTASENKR